MTIQIEGNTGKIDGSRYEFHTTDLELMLGFNHKHAMPDGTKFIRKCGGITTIVHQQPPHTRRLRWLHRDSIARHGSSAEYRMVTLSFPYTIVVASIDPRGRVLRKNEIYYSTKSLRRVTDRLLYPSLLNVSVMGEDPSCYTWICTQYYKTNGRTWVNQFHDLLEHTWNGGFNLSSEDNEGDSWFSRSAREIEQISTVEKWEELSKRSGAAMHIPWLESPHTVQDIIDRQHEHFVNYSTSLSQRMKVYLQRKSRKS